MKKIIINLVSKFWSSSEKILAENNILSIFGLSTILTSTKQIQYMIEFHLL